MYFLYLITLIIPTYTSTVLRDGEMVRALRSGGAQWPTTVNGY